jgi:hypothetical protein
VLLVAHGVGRGRRSTYQDEVLAMLERDAPDVHRRLVLHRTGAPPPSLDGIGAVLMWLCDPLPDLFPECYAEAKVIEKEAIERGIPVANPPDALANPAKHRQARLWREAGLPTPAHYPFDDAAELAAVADQVTYPAIVRPRLRHRQLDLHICATRADIDRLPPGAFAQPGSITTLIDTREGYRRMAPGTVWARWYHKRRAMVFGDRVIANHVFFSDQPIVGLKSSTFPRWSRTREQWTLRFRRWPRRVLEADYAYFRDGVPDDHADVLREANRVLGIDYSAIDYSTTADGGLVLWESNPYFGLHPIGRLAGPRRLAERTPMIYRAIGDYAVSLLDRR